MENNPKKANATETRTRTKVADPEQSLHARSSEVRFINGNDESPAGSGKKPGVSSLLRKTFVTLVVIAAAVGVFTFFSGKKDDVDNQTQQQWAASFAAALPLKVDLVESSQIPKAISEMQIPPTDKQNLQTDIDNGRTRLVWVYLRDNCAEDGDIVRIDSGGFSRLVNIKNSGEGIPVPEPPSGTLNIVGIQDGGGGITVEMKSGSSPVNLPVMTVGQALGVPVMP